MVSRPATARAGAVDTATTQAYFAATRARVDGFVDRHFTWPGTLRLHRAAFGWDILRAPVNAALSPILVLTRLAGFACRRAGWYGPAAWLAGRRILLRTAVARQIETLIVTDLLELPLGPGRARDPAALERAVLAAPQLREFIRRRASAEEARALARRVADTLGEYAGTRSAVAEMTTALCALIVGFAVFQALTPGMISMAPGVAGAVARTNAIAEFPLGATLGGVWYGVFRPDASPLLHGATLAGLVMLGSVFAAFAGVLADPVQSRFGIHRRRLGRLLDTLEGEMLGTGARPFVAREHFMARSMDLWDALASALRVFRN